MAKFFDDTMEGLLQAVEIEKGTVPLRERKNMPAKTFYVTNEEEKIIDELINIRKTENVSQTELANLIGINQQAVSRIEKKKHSPSLKLFYSMAEALGYELRLVKKTN